MTPPLEGITVPELANWVAAPGCTVAMADMGADVSKVEPLTGDGRPSAARSCAGGTATAPGRPPGTY